MQTPNIEKTMFIDKYFAAPLPCAPLLPVPRVKQTNFLEFCDLEFFLLALDLNGPKTPKISENQGSCDHLLLFVSGPC
ncbi:hypothetical protein L596_024853 [Steinernema carpocapsae]|uniref:Uncharacterized protein n=1 Tax=Steinernema carpocapsae TaxID=34508 RepID=A0A4U5M600_STECR|nr:hypothetical protein L596_024853 [Steinernema carpocapsae]